MGEPLGLSMGPLSGCLKRSTAGGSYICGGKLLLCVTGILVSPGDAPQGGLQGTPLPHPNISFHLWTEDDQLCECPGVGAVGSLGGA